MASKKKKKIIKTTKLTIKGTNESKLQPCYIKPNKMFQWS